MAFTIEKIQLDRGATVVAKQRLWVSNDGKSLVQDGDPEAATLFCTPGQVVSASDARKFGLVEPEVKEMPPSENKESKPAATKGRKTRG